MASFRPLRHCLRQLPAQPRALLQRADATAQLERRIRQQLPETIAPHCRIAALERNRLTLLVESSAWATRLRYLSAQLLTTLRRDPDLAGLVTIQIRIASPAPLPAPQSAPPPISAESAHQLQTCAERIADPRLREPLLRLARRGQPPDSK